MTALDPGRTEGGDYDLSNPINSFIDVVRRLVFPAGQLLCGASQEGQLHQPTSLRADLLRDIRDPRRITGTGGRGARKGFGTLRSVDSRSAYRWCYWAPDFIRPLASAG